MSNIQIWQGPNGVVIPNNIKDPNDIVPFAQYLTDKQKNQIVAAFQIEAYDMAAEYAWKKAMVKLKETLATLGVKFIGEMLGREDIDDYTPVDAILTDYNTIQLAEQLGVVGNTAALKLRQANELITHFFSNKADEDIDFPTAFVVVKSSIQYILGEQDISIAIEFSNFRNRLLNETLSIEDAQVEQIINSPLFYLRTINSILLSSIKSDKGVVLEHSLGNFNLLIPHIWESIGENDKWNIGTAYRDVTAAGNTIAASGLKKALLKVGGFDFVPENLRSVTFKKVARNLIDTHYAFNNFYNEPPIVSKLASLGSTIPAPALIDCIQAYLVVYLGNRYGVSINAVPIAEKELSKLTFDRWEYYFGKVLKTDEYILWKLQETTQINRFSAFLNHYGITKLKNMHSTSQLLYEAILKNNTNKVRAISYKLIEKIQK